MKHSFVRILSILMCAALLVGAFSAAAAAGMKQDREAAIQLMQRASKLTITGSHYVAKGKKITLKASEKVTWKTSNKKIATVSSSGVVKGIRAGTVKITATAKNSKAKQTWKMTVTPKAVKKVSITAPVTELNLTDTKSVTLQASASPAEAAQSFTWTSSDPDIAKVSSKGKVTAVSKGSVKLTAAATDGSKKKASVTITVTGGGSGRIVKVGIITLDPAESGYREKNVQDLMETFTQENGYDATFVTAQAADMQLQAARGLIAGGVDYLLICAADVSGWDDVLTEAKDCGIKVILYDRMINCDPELYTAAVVSSMSKEGELAVKWLADQKLKEYRVVHIQGAIGSDAQIGRSGALEAKCKSESSWTMVAQGTGGDSWDPDRAYQVTASAIKAGKKFNVIYAENDGMAMGAVRALDEAGITHGVNGDVLILGFDCNKWALRLLLAGEWNADVQCSPFQAGTMDKIIQTLESGGQITGMNSLKQIFVNEKVFDARTITQADVDKYGLGD